MSFEPKPKKTLLATDGHGFTRISRTAWLIFAPTDKAADKAADDPRAKFDREVTASDTLDDFPGGLSIQIGKPSASQRTLSVVVRIDVSKLEFATQDGRKKQRIAFVSALLDAQGKVVTAKEGWMDLALTPETYDRLVKTGLNAGLTFHRQLRVSMDCAK